ncbi:hypothetical protein P152DRAFT_107795 [Eremomyces bilateralis CBS 781.70]|uniref:Meiotic expression up-regulated protein 14 n=1 Tax=Eremomyces bilateralis CBS 781.70 TaxID=1392243 RepID=A0A6G1GD46_9PEZI|nr:uncharacterized protein P152DRAFT_107795 [Eremomyces bilateralis CBS 781.70]KAF1816017.1 hypothetical protein P152DRAFT_107795 [Eremomyces bilateralis CBS 781.70]
MPINRADSKASKASKASTASKASSNSKASKHSVLSSKSNLRHFSVDTLRGMQQPTISRKIFRLIKSEKYAIRAAKLAGRERAAIAQQLTEWGEDTDDHAVSQVSDKVAVLLLEIANQEEGYADQLEEYRSLLKQIRNMENSVVPVREKHAKLNDEFEKLKLKEPNSPRGPQLQNELTRSEAGYLVTEAQLNNVTRQTFKRAIDLHIRAVFERAEKQAILARHAHEMLGLLDDSTLLPNETRPVFTDFVAARGVLNSAEGELATWTNSLPEFPTPTRRAAGAAGTEETGAGEAGRGEEDEETERAAV